jgi:hypothetical protein
MPLRDHFHPPLSEVRHWESFHSRWASTIADYLDAEVLPEGYFAEVQVHVGNRVEVDIAAFEGRTHSAESSTDPAPGPTQATASTSVWSPPAPQLTWPAQFPDRVEVLVFQAEAGPTLVSAVELVSPRNKDRAQSRRDFAIKCASALKQGVGLVIVDVVTSRRANLHNELAALLEMPAEFPMPDRPQYAVSYQPVQHEGQSEIRIWHEVLALGQPLPELPLPLDKGQIWKRHTSKPAAACVCPAKGHDRRALPPPTGSWIIGVSRIECAKGPLGQGFGSFTAQTVLGVSFEFAAIDDH